MNFDVFDGHEYLNLKTFRRSGQAMPTPVWFARDGAALYITTVPTSGKIKRVRNNPLVEAAPCAMDGALLGEWQQAQARILTDDAARAAAHALLKARFGHNPMWANIERAGLAARAYLVVTAR